MKSSTRKEIINIIEKANYLFEEAEAKCESSDNIGFSAIALSDMEYLMRSARSSRSSGR